MWWGQNSIFSSSIFFIAWDMGSRMKVLTLWSLSHISRIQVRCYISFSRIFFGRPSLEFLQDVECKINSPEGLLKFVPNWLPCIETPKLSKCPMVAKMVACRGKKARELKTSMRFLAKFVGNWLPWEYHLLLEREVWDYLWRMWGMWHQYQGDESHTKSNLHAHSQISNPVFPSFELVVLEQPQLRPPFPESL